MPPTPVAAHEAPTRQRARPSAWARGIVVASVVSRLLRRLRSLAQTPLGPLETFADNVAAEFYPGLRIDLRSGEVWTATLDALHRGDREVVAMVRLTPHHAKLPAAEHPTRMTEPRYVPAGVIEFSALEPPRDVVVQYAFPQFLGVERNIDLFTEFARNELTRVSRRRAREATRTKSPAAARRAR